MTSKHVLLLILSVIMAFPLAAQKDGGKRSRAEMRREFKEFKIKYIAQEIELGASQIQEFTELYSQMEDEKHKVFSATRKLERSVKANKNATEKDYQSLSEAMTDAKAKDAEISKRYDEKFSRLLTAKQVYKMKDAEEGFRRKMHEMRHKKAKGKKK